MLMSLRAGEGVCDGLGWRQLLWDESLIQRLKALYWLVYGPCALMPLRNCESAHVMCPDLPWRCLS